MGQVLWKGWRVHEGNLTQCSSDKTGTEDVAMQLTPCKRTADTASFRIDVSSQKRTKFDTEELVCPHLRAQESPVHDKPGEFCPASCASSTSELGTGTAAESVTMTAQSVDSPELIAPQDTCSAADVHDNEDSQRKLLLVVGECGDGKSTLINALRDPERSGEAAAGLKGRGVTKTIEAYIGKRIEGIAVDYLDTPGVGDTDVTPMKVLTMIEKELITDEVHDVDAIDGIIVTTPIPDGRVKLGAQVVQLLVEHGFIGADKWQNVILVGTKADRATTEELELFRTEIQAQFFATAPGGTGTFVETSISDQSQLCKAIAELPAFKVQYGTPDPSKMAEAFAEKLGITKEHFQQELDASRAELQAQLNAEFAEREAAMKLEMEGLRKQHRQEREQLEKNTSLEAQRLRRDMEAKVSAKEAALQKLQMADPAQRRALEAQVTQMQDKIEADRQQYEQQQRHWSTQMDQKERDLRHLLRQLEEKERAISRARNYNFGSVSSSHSSCLHRRTRNWGNAHGRGTKCIDCKAELGRR